MHEHFRLLAAKFSQIAGSAGAFAVALIIILTWAVTGPFFDFSNTWQLLINTCTTIATFLMVFLIQNTQNRDARAMQLKLDELLKASKGARSALVDIEEMSDEELDKIHREFQDLHRHAAQVMKKRGLSIAEFRDDMLKDNAPVVRRPHQK